VNGGAVYRDAVLRLAVTFVLVVAVVSWFSPRDERLFLPGEDAAIEHVPHHRARTARGWPADEQCSRTNRKVPFAPAVRSSEVLGSERDEHDRSCTSVTRP